jgi:SAM-dependent methyltransferase
MSAQAGSGSEERVLSTEETRRFYDRFGAKQDRQFYEAAPLDHMLAHGDFGHAASVFELGCGTGRFAERLLREHLHPHARYLGVDLSTTMVGLATRRLAPWRERASVQLSEGSPSAPLPAGGCDRFGAYSTHAACCARSA